MEYKGLDGLQFIEEDPGQGKGSSVRIMEIDPNPFQPRQHFSEDKIMELAQSIKTYGLLQPILVRRVGRRYQLVAGERRLIACKRLGWVTIQAIVKEINDSAMAAMALIENLQRENLNFIEEADGYARLMQEFNMTQEVLAQRLGKSQSTIANKMRLLKLPAGIRAALLDGNLTERHARALLKLESEEQQKKMVQDIIGKGLTVSQAEEKIDVVLGLKEGTVTRRQPKGIIKDFRIFLNTIRQAVKIIEDAGLRPEVKETVEENHVEITIRLKK